MDSTTIRQKFLAYFAERQHKIVPSAPIVNKDDPTLMFVNAGMNPFKDYFLGNLTSEHPRVADTQTCLRVSGKHNDLDEVGRDGYHHTMFEMLGNWSFGDYFKKEAIEWAWGFLTDVLGIEKDRLYVSVFGGDQSDGLEEDTEAADYWSQWISPDRILRCDKRDNFWEMGDVGPCGPCSEIHVDMRDDAARAEVDGRTLVNEDHPQVIEIWNLVFIQYTRQADGQLQALPAQHVDTGMGFERLAMVMQSRSSSYDTDVFAPYIKKLEELSGVKYTASYEASATTDLAMRVVADHVRAVAFAIADGQMPSNTGAGYVIRRILRRAVRYYYSFLQLEKPIMHELVPVMLAYYGDTFPSLKGQGTFVQNVILEEEKSFLQTLVSGLGRLEQQLDGVKELSGEVAFELYDTYGFPYDLTTLIAAEKSVTVDEAGFQRALKAQKDRSRADSSRSVGDWTIATSDGATEMLAYDHTDLEGVKIRKHRTVDQKAKSQVQLVLDRSPFYPRGGGQVGDTGVLTVGSDEIQILDTIKENELILHIADRLPADASVDAYAQVDAERRASVMRNHTATHLLHAALREVLGTHVQQRGSLVGPEYLRFDFSHFQKMSDEEIKRVQDLVNERIRQDIPLQEARAIPIAEAQQKGAMMLFGEKYGETVRMITFDPEYSRELCGGCHVPSTGQIGWFLLTGESAIAAGVRRVEAVTGVYAQQHVERRFTELEDIQSALGNSQDTLAALQALQERVRTLEKKVESFSASQAADIKQHLIKARETIAGVPTIIQEIEMQDGKAAKTLVFELLRQHPDTFVALGVKTGDKAQLLLGRDKENTALEHLDASALIKLAAREIRGGGGGQKFFATAGGSDASGLSKALEVVRSYVSGE